MIMEIIQREAVYLWYYFTLQLRQIFPYWVLGMIIGSVISVFVKDKIHSAFRSLGDKRLGIFGIFIASALGIASPLCMYGTIPIAASFSKGGIRDDWLAAFMMSSILLNPQLIIYSAALGTKALVIRIVSCFVCGIAAGLLIRLFYKNGFFKFDGFSEPKSRDVDKNLFLRFIKNLGRNVKATGLYFLIGVVLSAVFQRYVPSEWISAVFGGNEAWGVLMAATIGVPLRAGQGVSVVAVVGRRYAVVLAYTNLAAAGDFLLTALQKDRLAGFIVVGTELIIHAAQRSAESCIAGITNVDRAEPAAVDLDGCIVKK